ncbi:MAG TPA: hypothetical protein VK922_09075, partial [Gemmatimonadaceae bacterium]|nr:hypothetical protein [Gemmatimonadaceae bacterium]
MNWALECSACDARPEIARPATVCASCGQPLLVRYALEPMPRSALVARWDMWRYAPLLPLRDGETPVTLGEGGTPLLESPRLARTVGVRRLWIKDEGLNP